MKITEYPAATTFDAGDVLLKDGGAGTKKIAASDAVFAMLDTVGIPSLHRQLSRWKNLGSSITTAQKASIADGSFRDLWIGDYWTIEDGSTGSSISITGTPRAPGPSITLWSCLTRRCTRRG